MLLSPSTLSETAGRVVFWEVMLHCSKPPPSRKPWPKMTCCFSKHGVSYLKSKPFTWVSNRHPVIMSVVKACDNFLVISSDGYSCGITRTPDSQCQESIHLRATYWTDFEKGYNSRNSLEWLCQYLRSRVPMVKQLQQNTLVWG